jgi:hypothetical protein
MQDENLTEFSGVAGRVLNGSISVGSMISGMIIGLLMIGGSLGLLLTGAHGLITPFTQGVMALALARFATNGLFGEWDGSIFSDKGGPWSEVGQVAMRYLILSSIWMLPLVAIMLRMENGAPMGMMMDPAAASKMVFLGFASLLAMMLTPPLFMIVSVGADNFADVFAPDHWRSMFSGRLGDLLMVYVVYTGGMVMVLFLCLLPVMLASVMDDKLALLAAALCACLVFGVSLNLLGRLCGFFAFGELGLTSKREPVERTPAPESRPPVSQKKQVRSSPASIAVAADPMLQQMKAEAEAKPAPLPVAPAAPASTTQSSGPVTLPELDQPVAGEKKPPLMDAQERVARAVNRFDHDPHGAISALSELRETFATHPQVEQALTLCLYRCGQTNAAISMARSALPLCLQRGHSRLAAAIYKEIGAELNTDELNGEQLIAIAAALAKMEEWMTAAKAFVKIIERDPGEARAIKGMLQVADGILYKKSKPEAAAKIYRYLLANCPPSSFVSLMQDGLREAEKRMSQPV